MSRKASTADEALFEARLETGRTLDEELKALRTLARWLDSKFEILGFKFGADALVGLVPVAGDLVTLAAGTTALFTAIRLRLPWHVCVRIFLNLVTDAGLGAIPILGDLFDFFFRSHKANFQMVEHHALKRAAKAHRKA